MKSDEILWDDRYRGKKYPDTADDLIRNYCHLATRGRALDLAAGNGRNSQFLAVNGFKTDAVDISGVAIELIRGKEPEINCIHQDLDDFDIEPDSYDLIANVNFLDRHLFPHIRTGLKKDGILIFKTFLDTHFQYSAFPDSNRDHYLQSNELLHAFLSLQVLFYQEKEVIWPNGEKREEASLVARKQFG